jgi:biofilm protein TabA
MFIGDIKIFNREKNLLPIAIQQALQHILNRDVGALAPGRYEMDHEGMYFLVQELHTNPASERRLESHVAYTDIQLLLEGEEAMGISRYSPDLQVDEDKLDQTDVIYYKGIVNESYIILKPGIFTVFFPWDVHRVNCSVNESVRVKKVVVKVHNSLLGI